MSKQNKSASAEIILQVIQQVKDRSRKDIRKWRRGMLAAEDTENPRWFLLQDIFSDLLTDGHLGSVMELRSSATLNHPFYVTDLKGESLEEQTNLLQKKWFFDSIQQYLEATYFHHTLLQYKREGENISFDKIPRRNVCTQLKRVYLEADGDRYIDYSAEQDVIEILHSSDFGIINDIVPNLIWKRNLLQSDAEFSERFGMPLITAMTANRADAQRIHKALRELGEAGTGVLPLGSQIQVHSLSNAGNPEKVYLDPAKFHDNQVSKRFLSSTTMVDEGANRSQTEVHAESLDDKIARTDRRMVAFIINDHLFPILQRFGLPFDNTKMKFSFDETESLSIEQEWKITNEALNHFDLDTTDIEKRFNLKIIGKKEPKQEGFAANFR